MRLFYSILFFLSTFFSFAQASLGMSLHIPTITSYTSAYSNTLSVNCYIKNTGSSVFSGSITLHVDTLGYTTGQEIVTYQYNNITILAGDSSFVLVNIPITSQFFKGGGGTVVIVWPKATNAPTTDTLKLNVYVPATIGIRELERTYFSIYPNPSSNTIHVRVMYEELIMKKIKIYDLLNRPVQEIEPTPDINISDLPAGLYWLTVYFDERVARVKFMKE